MLQGEHSAILLTFIKLPFVIKIFVLSIFEWLFYTGFTKYMLQDQILSVCLTDTNSNEDIHINDLLVHEGYAQFCPDTNETLHSAHLHQQEVNQSAILCIVQSVYNAMFGALRYRCVISESCSKGKFYKGLIGKWL